MRQSPADRCKVPQAFWRSIESFGLHPAAVLRQARLPITLHLHGQAILNTEQYFALWRAVGELVGDPGFGVKLVESTSTAVYPPSSLVAFHAQDYRDGLLRTARFKQLCSPEQLLINESNGDCVITTVWLHAAGPEPELMTDVTFASLIELGRRGTGQRLLPRRVEFTRPDPKCEAHKAYFGCPIRYNSKRNALVLVASDLGHPFPGHNPELLEILTPALASALGELQASSSISEQVKTVLKRRLASGRPELSDVARELGTSDRTLQRRITDAGTTFRDLLMESRQELGRQLLADPSAAINEVACLLGYQDTSSFYRAFRYWEGVSPNQWRERNDKKSIPEMITSMVVQ